MTFLPNRSETSLFLCDRILLFLTADASQIWLEGNVYGQGKESSGRKVRLGWTANCNDFTHER